LICRLVDTGADWNVRMRGKNGFIFMRRARLTIDDTLFRNTNFVGKRGVGKTLGLATR